MLTRDLVRVRRLKGEIVPAYARGAAVERLLPVARTFDATLAGLVGQTRDDVSAALAAVDVPARDRVAALGLRKILEDRAEFVVVEGVDPEQLRSVVFFEAARAHRALEMRDWFDRDAVLAKTAAELATTPAALEEGLYADLRGSERLHAYEPLAPEEAVERYNLGLAQALLLRATHVVATLEGASPERVRQVFRAARFHGLIHVVRRAENGATVIELDGPFSLFEASQRYGFRLAMWMPSLLACERFSLRADVVWGKERTASVFRIGPETGLCARVEPIASRAPEVDAFAAAFERLGSLWSVVHNERVFALPGEIVCVPDLVFTNVTTGEEIYFELFGFWSRTAVWNRIELVRKGLGAPIILAAGKQLRVSEEVLADDEAAELYVFKTTLSPRAVHDRLEALSRKPQRKRAPKA